MEVLSEKEEKLFDRKQVVVSLPVEKQTPSRAEVIAELAKKFGNKETISLREIKQKFGHKNVMVTAMIYVSKESLEKFESKHLAARSEAKKTEKAK